MKIEIREMKKPGVVQITSLDERWYLHPDHPDKPFPSWTWVADSYPKGIGFYRWLAEKGWDESIALRDAAGDRGSKVHKGIEILVSGGTLALNDSLPDSDGKPSEITVEEWESLISFRDWWLNAKPEVIKAEETVFNFNLWIAGTLDLKCKIDGEIWIIDFKTSQNVWPSHEIQVNGYRTCEGMEDVQKLGLLQIGYRKNKKHWKMNEVAIRDDLLNAAHTIWKAENEGKSPRQIELPTSLTLNGESDATNRRNVPVPVSEGI